jgi:hypothetical protein
VRVGNLVRPVIGHCSTNEEDWVGVVIDFHVHVDQYGEPRERYAIVCWNVDFPQEEEYPDFLEVIG